MNGSVVLIRGGGDLASGVAIRLHKVGIKVLITELAQPLAIRRLVSFSEAIYQGSTIVEGVTAQVIQKPADALGVFLCGEIPVLVDPECASIKTPEFDVIALVDARMTKKPPEVNLVTPIVIGLGPGFVASENCHAVIETNRGHFLGRVIWKGSPEPNTGTPGKVGGKQQDRVLRAPTDGIFHSMLDIGDEVVSGDLIAEVSGKPIIALFDGVLRGLIRDSIAVTAGMKVGDLDPRNDPRYASKISEKSLAIGGGVLEALLTRPEIRSRLWI